uniref:Calcium-dependent phosphotriesterase n=1 Tax=Mycena chlorophos TaxID=658473 RepID=A0ABQ0MBV1_MYCCL|nr:predicted protein [Mycena chlorophos]
MKWWLVPVLSAALWRCKRPLRQILFERDIPLFYAGGDALTQCATRVASSEFTSCEDATIWELSNSRQKILVSCDANRKHWNTVMGPLRNPEPRGSLWVLDGADSLPQRLELANYPPDHNFHPLGIAISPSTGEDGSSNLFVVNHARKRSYIEQFTLAPNSGIATHIRTLSSPYFVAPNSISLTSPNSFYLSNDHLMTRRLPFPLGSILPLVETILCLPLSWVAHVAIDPETGSLEHTFVAPFIPFANGVALSPNGFKVAVASTSLSAVYMYERDPITNALKHPALVPMLFHPDNLEFDHTGALIVAGHPNFIGLTKVKGDLTGKTVAPSWVVAVDDDLQVTTLFQSNGALFSESTTGLRDRKGALYVAGLYAQPGGLLVCEGSE